MDWYSWHQLYGSRSSLTKRLQLVRRHLRQALDAAPDGEISLLSICAGDARDVSGVLAKHRRARDVKVDLIELSVPLIDQGRRAFEAIGCSSQVTYHQSDATLADTYSERKPAQIVMACGMLGLVTCESTNGFVRTLSAVVKPKGALIWTRSLRLRTGTEHTELFRKFLAENGFQEVRLDVTRDRLFRRGKEPRFVVGTHRYEGGGEQPLPRGRRLFEIEDL